mmetsp:Transcript_5629/g.6424  ORF Transcript_5629/g.6424 Transcript_5629/m.6424 type:complete len:329 (+) Transcript_5629:305-1291(+)
MTFYNEEEFSRDDFHPDKQKILETKGWNKEAWDKNDPSLMTYYISLPMVFNPDGNELDWRQLPEDRKYELIRHVYDEAKWDKENDDDEIHESTLMEGDPNGEPKVLKLLLNDIFRFDISYFNGMEAKSVDLCHGDKFGHDMTKSATMMNMHDFISELRKGQTKYYFKLEDDDCDKSQFAEVGNCVMRSIRNALSNSEVGGIDGVFKPEWQQIDPKDFDWSLWMGAKGTKTANHYDTDLFNFLYVVEGKKRTVIIPNDRRTDDMFKLQSFISGGALADVDILHEDYNLHEGAVDLVVNGGEGVVIPYRWWHSVENLEDTMAYGFRVTGN